MQVIARASVEAADRHDHIDMVRMIAGAGDLVVLPGDGHLLGLSDEIVTDRLGERLPDVLATPA